MGGSGQFVSRNDKKGKIIEKLTQFWESNVPVTSLKGFTGCYFADSEKVKLTQFVTYWSAALISDLEADEAKELSSFPFPNTPLSPSGSKALKMFHNALLQNSKEDTEAQSPPKLDADQLSTSLGDFIDSDQPDKKKTKKTKKQTKIVVEERVDSSDNTSNASSDDEAYDDDEAANIIPRDNECINDDDPFKILPTKFRQIIKRGQPGFKEFLKPFLNVVTTKTELQDALEYHRSAVICTKTVCHQNRISFSHHKCKKQSLVQETQLPIILP